MNILLINNQAEAMERQRLVISENCGVNEIRCCRPGLDLLKTTTSFIPDMAIIDAGNQSYDCLNMVHHLRKINPRVYISLITRPEEQELRQEAERAGVDDIFAGPPSESDLLSSVEKNLDTPTKIEHFPGAGRVPALTKRRKKRKKPYAAALNIIGNAVFGILLVLMLTLSFFLVQGRYTGGVPEVFGHKLYVVLSGSMNPAFDTGSLVLVRHTEPELIEKGDIITFSSGAGGGTPTTHRVVDIQNDGDLAFVTRGDANNVNDPNPVPAEQVIGRVRGFLPYLGYLMGFARTRTGMICLVFIPGLLVIARELRNIYKVSAERKKSA